MSLPSHLHGTDSSIHLNSDGKIPLSDHPSGSTSKLIEYENNSNNYYQHDPAVLIPDHEQNEIVNVIMPSKNNSQSNTGTPSPSNNCNNNNLNYSPPIQQQTAPIFDTNSVNNNNNQNGYAHIHQHEQISLELQYYDDNNHQNDIPPTPVFEHSHSMENMS